MTYKTAYRQMQKKAHAKVFDAVQKGQLERPHECCLCGVADSCDHVEIVAHHWNGYKTPLDVWWICKSCNYQLEGVMWHCGAFSQDDARKFLQKNEYFGKCFRCNLASKYGPHIEELRQCIELMFANETKYSDLINFVGVILPTHVSPLITFEEFKKGNEFVLCMMMKFDCDRGIREEFGLSEREDDPYDMFFPEFDEERMTA